MEKCTKSLFRTGGKIRNDPRSKVSTHLNNTIQSQSDMLVFPPSHGVVSQHLHVQGAFTSPRIEKHLFPHFFALMGPALILFSKPYFRAGVRYLLHPDRAGDVREGVHPFVTQRVKIVTLSVDLGAKFRFKIF